MVTVVDDASPTSGADLRVVSWNVWWRFGTDWQQRQSRIVLRLRELAPDIIGLQEVWATNSTTQADVLAEVLGMHAAFAAPSLPPPPETPDRGVTATQAFTVHGPIDGVHPSDHAPVAVDQL